MVHRLAWFYEGSCGGSLDVDDLLQAGMIALDIPHGAGGLDAAAAVVAAG